MADPPDDGAYGQVTNPERYSWLHDAAIGVVRQLEQRFDVLVERGVDLDEGLAALYEAVAMFAVTPSAPEAAPLTFSLTTFPGLHIRAGQWHVVSLPACGCDACDEQPAELLERLHEWVDAVAAGRLTEVFDGRVVRFAVDFGNGHRSSGGHVVRADQRRLLAPPGERAWAPWPARPAT